MQNEKFTYNGEEYEIKVGCDHEKVYVKVFKDGKPVNPEIYTATKNDIEDIEKVQGTDIIEVLKGAAKQAVIDQI